MTKTAQASFGDRLLQRRKEYELTRAALSKKVGMPKGSIRGIENGKSLRPRNIERIARALNVRPAWLMFGVNEVEDLDEGAVQMARSWARLKEPGRSAMKETIRRLADG